jgi:hypothetical protein
MKKRRKPASLTRMYQGGGITSSMQDLLFRKGGVETRSAKRPAACMKRKKK